MTKAEKKIKTLVDPDETKTIKHIESKNSLVKYEVISEVGAIDITKLIELYNEDKYMARVNYFNHPSKFEKTRVVYFEFPNGNFEFAKFRVKCCITKTNKMYFIESKISSVGYKNGKFYYTGRNLYRNLTYNYLYSFDGGNKNIVGKFIELFGYIRNLGEQTWTRDISFNTIKRNKLFSLNAIKKHYFKQPLPVIDILMPFYTEKYGYSFNFKLIKENLSYLENITSLTNEFLDNPYFEDSCRMAKILGTKVNCKWSENRLFNEHNKWSKEISTILLKSEKEFDLNISDIYKKFSEFSGYTILKTNKELLAEGINMKHCVGTYIEKVNKGLCGIYHIDNHTLELGNNSNNGLIINQFKGKFNSNPPEELFNKVNKTLLKFNKTINKNLINNNNNNNNNNYNNDPLTEYLNLVDFNNLF
jgi:hypothetical protein